MSIISQIGVVILIAFIVLVLFRSNKNLKKASEEGENFVDEWALRQEKKEEIKQQKEAKKLEAQKEKENKKLQKQQRKQSRKGLPADERMPGEEYSPDYEDRYSENYGEGFSRDYEDSYPQSYGEEFPSQDYEDKRQRSYGKAYSSQGYEDGYQRSYGQGSSLQEYEDSYQKNYKEESSQGYAGDSLRVNADWLYNYEEQEKKRQEQVRPEQPVSSFDYGQENSKIVPMKKRETTGITLMKLDANHRVMARYRVNQIPFTIGRSSNNDLVLDDLCVARNHCRIIERDGRYILEDVGTMNKLYVNGMVTAQVPLSDGLRVYIGNEEFQIAVEGGRSQSTRLYKNAEGSYE